MDLKIAWRSLRHSPGFTLLAVLILALGIGATTAIFSVVDAVILRPLAYRDPDRIVAITATYKDGGRFGAASALDFYDFQSQSTAFESMAAYGGDVVSVVTHSGAEFAGAAAVSQDFFSTIGVQPAQGRSFAAGEWSENPTTAIVSASFWQRHFGNRPFTAGQHLKVGDKPSDIIGIMPAGFHFPEQWTTDVWIPYPPGRDEDRSAQNYRVIGRLKPGALLTQAQTELSGIANRLAKAYPKEDKNKGVLVSQLIDYNVRNVKTDLYALFGAVTLVLLIVCANVANLLLARATGRVREIAIRAALGAGRAGILRGFFWENLLLAGAGFAGGVLMANLALPVLLALSPKYVPRLEQVRLDSGVLLFCLCASLLTSVLFGMAPAWHASRVEPNVSLRVGSSRGALGGSLGRLRRIFITAEIALSVVLLVSAGLLLRTFSAITSVNLGFRPDRLLVAEMSVPASTLDAAADAMRVVIKPLLARISSSPGVRSAALSFGLPPGTDHVDGDYIMTGQSFKHPAGTLPHGTFSIISPDYFTTMGIPLIAGRTFSERDDAQGRPVAIISETLARQSFPHQDPIGQTIACGFDLNSTKWMTIVGIARDVRIDGPTLPPTAEIYMPYLQHARPTFTIVVSDGPNPLSFAGTFRKYVSELDPEASLKLTTMENRLAGAVAAPRFNSILVSIFAGLAMVLAVSGIYGVMSYSVRQRTAEIGLRVALGADRGQVIRMVLAQALTVILIGLGVGLAGAAAATRILKSQLFGISASDPGTYAATLVLLATAGILASVIPAWQASRTEPLEALRQE